MNMIRKQIVSLSVCAVLLATAGPSGVFAQSPAKPGFTSGGEARRVARGEQRRSDLKASLDEEVARVKADTATRVDFKRLERAQNDPRNAKPQGGYTKGQKILVASIVIAVVVLAVVLALTIEEGDHPRCLDVPDDPFCID